MNGDHATASRLQKTFNAFWEFWRKIRRIVHRMSARILASSNWKAGIWEWDGADMGPERDRAGIRQESGRETMGIPAQTPENFSTFQSGNIFQTPCTMILQI